jgi:hypothetical protein
MDQALKDRLAANVLALPKMLSAWVMALAAALGVIWFQLPAEQQHALVQHSPLPVWAWPVAMSVLGIVARVWPQRSFMPAALTAPAPTSVPPTTP